MLAAAAAAVIYTKSLSDFFVIKTSALSSASLINVSDGLAAGELFSQLSVATIKTYFMTNYIHDLTRKRWR